MNVKKNPLPKLGYRLKQNQKPSPQTLFIQKYTGKPQQNSCTNDTAAVYRNISEDKSRNVSKTLKGKNLDTIATEKLDYTDPPRENNRDRGGF